MAQPYDLSGIASLQASVAQMLRDQKSGTVKFAGGFQTWLSAPFAPTGQFKAILSVGGTPSPTTTNLVRIALRAVRATLDLIAGGTGTVAANAVQAATPPTILLEIGRNPTQTTGFIGPVVTGGGTVANTSYDLSGAAALQTAANAMLADQQSGASVFVGNAKFQAILTVGGGAQATTINAVVALFAQLMANFDLLDQ